jgi:hypothetical protein
LRFNEEILSLTVDANQAILGTHDPFHAIHRGKSCPLQDPNGVENRIGIENPSAGLMTLAAVQITTPALMFRQTQRRQTLFALWLWLCAALAGSSV